MRDSLEASGLRLGAERALLVLAMAVSAVSSPHGAFAADDTYGGRLGLGVNYPGVGLRYCFTRNIAVEARGQMELLDSKIKASAYGGRLYWGLGPFGRILPYLCVEGDYGGSDDGISKATGYLGGLFAGVEYFAWKRFSVQADAGPAYVSLTGDSSTTSSVHFVVSFGLTYYMGSWRQGASEPAPAVSTTPEPTPAVATIPAARLAPPPAGKTNVAVSELTPQGVSASDAAVIADMVRNELVGKASFNVVEKANMDKVLAEQAFQQTGCTSAECAVKLGKLLNVKLMVVGSFGKLMDAYVLSLRAVDVETGQIVFSDQAQQLSSQKEVANAVRTMVEKFAKTAK